MVTSFARFSPFARGRIVGMAEAGAPRKSIRDTVRKKDGKKTNLRAIDGVLAHARKDSAWNGGDSRGGGRPQELAASEVLKLRKLMQDEVGLAKVTVSYCKKRLPFLRRLSKECVRRTLLRLGYAWRLRRGKAAIAKKYKPERLAWSKWVLTQPQGDLNRYAYVDGTTFNLARTPEEHEDHKRAALGKYCYRMSDGSDALEDQNVGASSYAKSQGQPIKIWVFFLQ